MLCVYELGTLNDIFACKCAQGVFEHVGNFLDLKGEAKSCSVCLYRFFLQIVRFMRPTVVISTKVSDRGSGGKIAHFSAFVEFKNDCI